MGFQDGWSRRKRITVWSSASVIAFLTLMFIIGTVVGPPKKDASKAAADASAITGSPSPTPSAVASTSDAPSLRPSATTASPKRTVASKPPATPSPASTTASAADRHAAAAILHANNSYYQDEFNRGVTVILARGDANSYPAFHSWYEKAATDVQPGVAAFSKADAHFTADNEPSSISDWRNDNGNLSADVATLASDGLGAGGPDDAAARQKVQADITQMHSDFAAAEHDADQVGAGK